MKLNMGLYHQGAAPAWTSISVSCTCTYTAFKTTYFTIYCFLIAYKEMVCTVNFPDTPYFAYLDVHALPIYPHLLLDPSVPSNSFHFCYFILYICRHIQIYHYFLLTSSFPLLRLLSPPYYPLSSPLSPLSPLTVLCSPERPQNFI